MNSNPGILSANRGGWRWVAALAMSMVVLAVWAASHAARFLEGPASPPMKADLMVVLGGDSGDRTLTAARIYALGYAPRVLLTGLEASPPEAPPAYLHWRARILVDAGVPPAHILYDARSGNSWEEAINTRSAMEAQGWRRALVVSDPYHMRRLSWAWNKAFDGSGLEFSLAASAPAYWKPDAWWRDERSAQAVINEYIKLAYYLIKY